MTLQGCYNTRTPTDFGHACRSDSLNLAMEPREERAGAAIYCRREPCNFHNTWVRAGHAMRDQYHLQPTVLLRGPVFDENPT